MESLPILVSINKADYSNVFLDYFLLRIEITTKTNVCSLRLSHQSHCTGTALNYPNNDVYSWFILWCIQNQHCYGNNIIIRHKHWTKNVRANVHSTWIGLDDKIIGYMTRRRAEFAFLGNVLWVHYMDGNCVYIQYREGFWETFGSALSAAHPYFVKKQTTKKKTHCNRRRSAAVAF